jgi:hypothetical protein
MTSCTSLSFKPANEAKGECSIQITFIDHWQLDTQKEAVSVCGALYPATMFRPINVLGAIGSSSSLKLRAEYHLDCSQVVRDSNDAPCWTIVGPLGKYFLPISFVKCVESREVFFPPTGESLGNLKQVA